MTLAELKGWCPGGWDDKNLIRKSGQEGCSRFSLYLGHVCFTSDRVDSLDSLSPKMQPFMSKCTIVWEVAVLWPKFSCLDQEFDGLKNVK